MPPRWVTIAITLSLLTVLVTSAHAERGKYPNQLPPWRPALSPWIEQRLKLALLCADNDESEVQLVAAAYKSRSLRLLGGASAGIGAEANAFTDLGRALLQDDDDENDDDDNGWL